MSSSNLLTISDIYTVEAFNALLDFSEAELQLFENFKSFLENRIKIDREYGIMLNKITSSNKSNVVGAFIVEKLWNSMSEDASNFSSRIKDSCDSFEVNSIPKLQTLVKEKKDSRKRLDKDKCRLLSDLKRLRNNVESFKIQYNQQLNIILQCKKEFREKASKNKKLNDITTKRNKATQKCQYLHNAYTLAINEYNDLNKITKEKLLPNLLNSNRKIAENILKEFKQIMDGYVRHLNYFKNELTNDIDPFTAYDKNFEPAKTYSAEKGVLLVEKYAAFDDSVLSQLDDNDLNPVLFPGQLSSYRDARSDLKEKQNYYNQEIKKFEKRIADSKNLLALLDKDAESLAEKNGILNVQRELNEYELLKEIYEELLRQIEDITYFSGESGVWSGEYSDGGKTLPRVLNQTGYEKLKDIRRDIPSEEIQKKENFKINHDIDLDSQPWYHGKLLREQAYVLLMNEGDFLLRYSENAVGEQNNAIKKSTNIVISIKSENSKDGVANWIIYTNEETNKYFVEGHKCSFESITELLEGLVVGNSILVNPIVREDWEIKHSDVIKGKKIGAGQYGEVYQGFYKNRKVAIKTCKDTVQQEDKVKFIVEGNQLKKFNHPNIVEFIGIAVDEEPIYIIMELVNGGSLLNYLKTHQSEEQVPLKKKMDMSRDCASGMQYLEECGVIHRDLAARNCLIEKQDKNNLRLKISDFGLSKELDSEKEYYKMFSNKTLPTRWAAVESFKKGIISHKTDVWSYGVTCWEIFSYGAQPYGMLSNLDIRELVISGKRLERPEDCPEIIFDQLIKVCWLENPDQRPSFSKIIETIGSLTLYEN